MSSARNVIAPIVALCLLLSSPAASQPQKFVEVSRDVNSTEGWNALADDGTLYAFRVDAPGLLISEWSMQSMTMLGIIPGAPHVSMVRYEGTLDMWIATSRTGDVYAFRIRIFTNDPVNWELQEVTFLGNITEPATTAPQSVHSGFGLRQNQPNPFSDQTGINYSVTESAYTSVDVYDLRGRNVRTLVSAEKSPGNFSVFWDGHDSRGTSVASGVYVVRLVSGTAERSIKISVAR